MITNAQETPHTVSQPNKLCLVYVRVSSDEQARGYSLPTQVESCRRYSDDRGYTVVDVFEDAHSGTELDRPGLNALIDAVTTLKPHAVVLHDVDRLGRDSVVQAIAERELTRHGARIEYVLGGGTDSASDILLKGVKQALAVYENYQRVERSRRGKNGRVQAGGVLVAARPAYGYRYIPGDRTGSLEPDPDEAPIIRQIFAWCADEGRTTYEIAKRLHDASIPTRADTNGVVTKKAQRHYWDPGSVARILRNETHKGVWHWNKTRRVQRGERKVQEPRPREEWLTLSVPAIVDEATWQRAQAQLDRSKANARRNAKRDYLLSGRVFCTCGRRWAGYYRKERGHGFYRCQTAPNEPWRQRCGARFSIKQPELESSVFDAIKAFLLDPEVRAAGVGAEQQRAAAERARATDHLRAVDRHLDEIDRRLASLLDDALTAGFPAEIVDHRKRDLLAERERRMSEREQALARLAAADVPELEAAIAALAPTVERAFAVAEPAELRRLLDLLRVDVHVIDRQTVRLTGVVGGVDGSFLTLSSSSPPSTR